MGLMSASAISLHWEIETISEIEPNPRLFKNRPRSINLANGSHPSKRIENHEEIAAARLFGQSYRITGVGR